ncbi:MAG: hypothetical protein ABI040_09390 [Rhodoferax sp.]
MRIALCNDVQMPLAFAEQCSLAAELGYAGLEIAQFTLGAGVLRPGASRRAQWRRAAADAGIGIAILHWLLVQPQGLSITIADASQRECTVSTMRDRIDLGADLGGSVLTVLRHHGYGDWVSVEPFEYLPDGPTSAARAIGYVRGLLELLP